MSKQKKEQAQQEKLHCKKCRRAFVGPALLDGFCDECIIKGLGRYRLFLFDAGLLCLSEHGLATFVGHWPWNVEALTCGERKAKHDRLCEKYL